MAPLTPDWAQPSHPDIQEVIAADAKYEFMTKSVSKIDLPPFGLFAKLTFPPCTSAYLPTYSTVQMSADEHLNLNSDLVYINHSCEPSLIFDMGTKGIIAGPKGLRVGQELTFFYPSTEWSMAQDFECLCNTPSCKGMIMGAKHMSKESLEGMYLNAHIVKLLDAQEEDTTRCIHGIVGLEQFCGKDHGAGPQPYSPKKVSGVNGAGSAGSAGGDSGAGNLGGAGGAISKSLEETSYQTIESNVRGFNDAGGARGGTIGTDPTLEALKNNFEQAKKMFESAQKVLEIYKTIHDEAGAGNGVTNGAGRGGGVTSREMSGEMGGDTTGTVVQVFAGGIVNVGV